MRIKYSVLFTVILVTIMSTSIAKAVLAGEGDVVKIDKAQFKAQIMDYEKSPKTWKYEGKIPCIVDFYADWCGPCRQASPALEKLAQKYKGQIIVYKVNTCLLYTSPSPRDGLLSRMPSSA